jgi:hypothetical protein
MSKRTFAALGVAVFAGLALPFGLPNLAHASSSLATTASMSFMPFPIAQPGTLTGSTTVTICVQPRDSTGKPVGVGATVWLSFFPGLFTAPPATGGTAMEAGTVPLNSTPTSYLTVASCTSQGSPFPDAVPVTYTAPATIPPHGRDVLIAADSSADSGTGGTCSGSGVCNNDTYVYSPVAQYVFTPAPPIAPAGSLAPGTVVNFTVTAEDSGGHPVPGAFLNLGLTSTATTGGTATGFNHFSMFDKEKITNTPQRFGSDSSAAVQVAYTAGSATAGTDTITAQDHPLTPTVTATTTYNYGATVPFSQAPYTAVTPFRVCDTRPTAAANQCNGLGGGPIQQGQSRAVTVTGTVTGGVVPSTATAIVVNLTAIAPSEGTYLSLSPAGTGSSHSISNVNPQAHAIVATLAEVAIGTGGAIDVYNNVGTVNVALDIEGYVDSTSLGLFKTATPTRICDTRAVGGGATSNQCNDSGPGSHPIAANGVLNFNVTNSGSPVPTTGVVTAVVFNLTAIAPTAGTVLTAYPGPSNSTRPVVSNVNVNANAVVPNRVIVPVPSGCTTACTVNLWNSVGSVNVAVDIDGWFQTSTPGTQFTALPSPARVCDTRYGSSAQGCTVATVGAGKAGVMNLNVTGIDGIPAIGSTHSPVAIVASITVIDPTTGTFVTVYPGNLPSPPTASDLNVPPSVVLTNLVVVGVDPTTGSPTAGTINIFNDLGNVNIIVDVFGYYS